MPDPRPGAGDFDAQAAEAEAEILARREAWGPEWPYWLSLNHFEPEPEADLF
jgi:hypothetical protein